MGGHAFAAFLCKNAGVRYVGGRERRVLAGYHHVSFGFTFRLL
jgi:hypothetical protein